MGSRSFTKKELRTKNIIEFPFMALILFIAFGLGNKGWWVFFTIILFGWYLSSLVYWKLYKAFILNKIPQLRFKFYSYLVGFQFIFIGVATYILIP